MHGEMQAVVLTGLADQQQVCDADYRDEETFFENPGMSRGFSGAVIFSPPFLWRGLSMASRVMRR